MLPFHPHNTCELNGYRLTRTERVNLKITLQPTQLMCELKGYPLTCVPHV